MNPKDFAFKVPYSVFVAWPSQSGKTRFTQQILKHIGRGILSKPIKKIVYAYSKWQPAFDEMRGNDSSIMFYEGLPTKEELTEWTKSGEDLLLVLDDLVYRVIQSFDCMELFSIYVHHLKVSVIFLSQNLFQQGKYSSVISLNCHYLVLLKTREITFK